jgi:excisionase family DNA binding protein
MKPPAQKPSRPPVDAVISEIMNIAQVAEYLHTHPSTIYRLLKRRKIPAFRLGSDWRFRRADLEQWVAAQEINVADEEPAAADAGGKRAARGPAARKPRRTRTQ